MTRRGLLGAVATIDRKGVAGDPSRLIGSQERDGSDDVLGLPREPRVDKGLPYSKLPRSG